MPKKEFPDAWTNKFCRLFSYLVLARLAEEAVKRYIQTKKTERMNKHYADFFESMRPSEEMQAEVERLANIHLLNSLHEVSEDMRALRLHPLKEANSVAQKREEIDREDRR